MSQSSPGNPSRTAICLVIDRLSAGFLGAYGNTWVRTPNFDRLAAQSFLLDNATIDSPSLDRLYDAYWRGVHAISDSRDDANAGLLAALADREVTTRLLTDEPRVADHPIARYFDSREQIEPQPVTSSANAIEDTYLARYFATAIETLTELDGPSLLWLHTRGLAAPWDAPLEFRNSYADEEDPEPPTDTIVPAIHLSEDHDPDELLGIVQSYAGQVTLLDTCLGALIGAIDDDPALRDSMLIVFSSRGFALGEHLIVGDIPPPAPLYSELVHVPWFIRLPASHGATLRSSALAQPCDLATTLASWWNVALPSNGDNDGADLVSLIDGEEFSFRNRAIVIDDTNSWAVRTAAWYLRNQTHGPIELFHKPDDRGEVNDVAGLCPDVVEKLQRVLDETLVCKWNSPLDEILQFGPD